MTHHDPRSTADKIHHALAARFHGAAIEVIDDSAKHAGHAGAAPGGQTHYTVKISAMEFAAMSRIARHRAVYAQLEPLFAAGLHALAIEANAP